MVIEKNTYNRFMLIAIFAGEEGTTVKKLVCIMGRIEQLTTNYTGLKVLQVSSYSLGQKLWVLLLTSWFQTKSRFQAYRSGDFVYHHCKCMFI